MMTLQHYLTIFVVALSIISGTYGAECHCHCRGFRGQSVCESIENLWRVANTNTEKLLEWERYRPFVERFSERWRKEIADIVEMKIDEYISDRKFFPKPENLVSRPEVGIENDFVVVSKPPEDGNDIVSNLLAKVEMVENRTMEVEEELKSERRVRRDLEKEVKETQSSLIFLGDQLQNVTVPVDMVNQVQIAIYSSLEDMNKTIYEDHLKKLYYKVDGVAYKNETRKLVERLEHVEVELHDGDNSSIVSKLAEDVKTLEENLHLLNNSIEDSLVPRIETINNSIGGVLIPRIQTLETETVWKNATEELESRMTSLLNHTELFKTALVDVWSDIQDIRNFEKKFQNFSEQWSTSLKEIQSEVELLKNESLINRLTEPPDNISNEIVQERVEDDGLTNYRENTLDPDITPNIVNRLKISENGTTDDKGDKNWEPLIIVDKLNVLENSTSYDEYLTWRPEDTPNVVNRSKVTNTEKPTTIYEEDATSKKEMTLNDEDSESIYREMDDTRHCGKPIIKDPNLLADVVEDSNGRNHLKFGCQPIGLYAVSYLPVPPRCEGGSWKEPFPTCTKLPNITTIEIFARDLQEKYMCSDGSVEFPDPTNCSQFFKCAHGKVSIVPCPPGLHFNSHLKVCDYPRTAGCTPLKNILDDDLEALIPPILIEPDNVDRPSSHLGTGSAGQLIVHPRSSFTLHCLYPKNVWGYPKWNVTYTYFELSPKNLIVREGNNRVSLSVTAATEENSGIYRCITPFGVQHAVEVVVKAVVCPPYTLDEEYEDVFYRPTPEGELRIMGARAEFQCEGGHKIFAQCMADGRWSRGLPREEECTLKKRKSDSIWNCKSLDVSKHPDLIIERNDVQKILTFKCARGKKLMGNSFARCRDDGLWSPLPKCE